MSEVTHFSRYSHVISRWQSEESIEHSSWSFLHLQLGLRLIRKLVIPMELERGQLTGTSSDAFDCRCTQYPHFCRPSTPSANTTWTAPSTSTYALSSYSRICNSQNGSEWKPIAYSPRNYLLVVLPMVSRTLETFISNRNFEKIITRSSLLFMNFILLE